MITRGVTEHVIAVAGMHGADENALRARLGDGDQVADEVHRAIWEQAIRGTGRRDLPVLYARECRVDGYGLLGLACKTAPDLREAILRMLRFVHVVASTVHGSLVAESLVVRRDGPESLGRHAALESTLAETWVSIGQITARPVGLSRVELAHDAEGCRDALTELFGCEIEPSTRNALTFATGALEAELRQADPAISAYLLEQLGADARTSTWTDRVARLLERAFAASGGSDRPGIEHIAKELAVSTRSLQRHLKDEHTSFRDVLEQTRLGIAKQLLRSQHGLGEIAFGLGFSDQSAFHRWFRRATGTTPGRFRSG